MFGSGFYNPYMTGAYYQTANLAGLGGRLGSGAGMASLASKAGIGKGLLSKFSFSGFLNGASKTLNVVNQAIPIFYQVKPMINNAKTMFKIMGAVKDDSPSKTVVNTNNSYNSSNSNQTDNTNTTIVSDNIKTIDSNNPTFFL